VLAVKVTVFRDVMPCRWIDIYRLSEVRAVAIVRVQE
jgi:hypothetical protein